MKYLTNAFSLQMLETKCPHTIHTAPVTAAEVAEAIKDGFISAVGHADTAAVIADLIGATVPCQRISIRMADGDILYVAQVTGGRLPEGATTLPEGMALTFIRITAD